MTLVRAVIFTCVISRRQRPGRFRSFPFVSFLDARARARGTRTVTPRPRQRAFVRFPVVDTRRLT